MSNLYSDENSIEYVVVKCFLRVIKDIGKYDEFRKMVKNDGVSGLLYGNTSTVRDSELYSCHSISDIVSKLVCMNSAVPNISSDDGRITMSVNHMLHFFLEPTGESFENLCKTGQRIFDLACNSIYGKKHNKKSDEDEILESTNIIELKSKLFQQYVNKKENGEIDNGMSFDSYIDSNYNKLSELLKKIDIKDFSKLIGKKTDGIDKLYSFLKLSNPETLNRCESDDLFSSIDGDLQYDCINDIEELQF